MDKSVNKKAIGLLVCGVIAVLAAGIFAWNQSNAMTEAIVEDRVIMGFPEWENQKKYGPLEKIEAELGTEVADLGLPERLSIRFAAEQKELSVSWNCETYDKEQPGNYVFLLDIPEGCTYEGTLPFVEVTLVGTKEGGKETGDEIPAETLDDLEIDYFMGNSQEAENHQGYMLLRLVKTKGVVEKNLKIPTTLNVVLKDGSNKNIQVSWESEDYNSDQEGTYIFYMRLPEGYYYEGELPYTHVVVGSDPYSG